MRRSLALTALHQPQLAVARGVGVRGWCCPLNFSSGAAPCLGMPCALLPACAPAPRSPPTLFKVPLPRSPSKFPEPPRTGPYSCSSRPFSSLMPIWLTVTCIWGERGRREQTAAAPTPAAHRGPFWNLGPAVGGQLAHVFWVQNPNSQKV